MANVIFVIGYIIIFICEVIRSYLDFSRLQFSKKIGHLITLIMVTMTVFVLLGKFMKQGGFSTQLIITVIYNIYVWHLAYLYVPNYKK